MTHATRRRRRPSIKHWPTPVAIPQIRCRPSSESAASVTASADIASLNVLHTCASTATAHRAGAQQTEGGVLRRGAARRHAKVWGGRSHEKARKGSWMGGQLLPQQMTASPSPCQAKLVLQAALSPLHDVFLAHPFESAPQPQGGTGGEIGLFATHTHTHTLPVAPLLVEIGAGGVKVALQAPVLTNIGAAGAARCDETESATHGPRRRLGGLGLATQDLLDGGRRIDS